MEKYTTTETKPKPELVAHVAKTLDGVSEELAKDLVSSGVEIAGRPTFDVHTSLRPREQKRPV